jgi:predicted metal-dependent HD superfamily phosphohydrolase
MPKSFEDQQQEAKELFLTYQEIPEISEIILKLEAELPKELSYHSVSHTLDVLKEVLLFGVVDGLFPAQLKLLAVAAAFHDAGYLVQYQNNEEIGAAMAMAVMETVGSYSEEDILQVKQIILDTQLIESPTGLIQLGRSTLSNYLQDADLSNYGREDFFEKIQAIKSERNLTELEVLNTTYSIGMNHRYATDAGKRLRAPQKEKNMIKLKEMLTALRNQT